MRSRRRKGGGGGGGKEEGKSGTGDINPVLKAVSTNHHFVPVTRRWFLVTKCGQPLILTNGQSLKSRKIIGTFAKM